MLGGSGIGAGDAAGATKGDGAGPCAAAFVAIARDTAAQLRIRSRSIVRSMVAQFVDAARDVQALGAKSWRPAMRRAFDTPATLKRAPFDLPKQPSA